MPQEGNRIGPGISYAPRGMPSPSPRFYEVVGGANTSHRPRSSPVGTPSHQGIPKRGQGDGGHTSKHDAESPAWYSVHPSATTSLSSACLLARLRRPGQGGGNLSGGCEDYHIDRASTTPSQAVARALGGFLSCALDTQSEKMVKVSVVYPQSYPSLTSASLGGIIMERYRDLCPLHLARLCWLLMPSCPVLAVVP